MCVLKPTRYLKGKIELEKRMPELGFGRLPDYFTMPSNSECLPLRDVGLCSTTVLNMSNYQMGPAERSYRKQKKRLKKALQLDDRLAQANIPSMAAIRFYHLEGGNIEDDFSGRCFYADPGTHKESSVTCIWRRLPRRLHPRDQAGEREDPSNR